MADPATVAAVLHRIDVAHQRFEQARLQLTDAQLLVPVLADGRSGKDLLAHVTFWDQRLLYAIDPDDGPDAFRLAPPVIAAIPYDEHWTDRVNERIWRLRRDQDWPTSRVPTSRHLPSSSRCSTASRRTTSSTRMAYPWRSGSRCCH